jgi:ribosomal protein S27AE
LCFADLRSPAPVREPVTVPAAAEAGSDGTAQSAPVKPAVARTPRPPQQETRWPCPRCGADVLMSLDSCPDCGAGFLAGATVETRSHLPLVGDMRLMSQAQRLMVGLAVSVLLMIGFVLVAEIGGHIFS